MIAAGCRMRPGVRADHLPYRQVGGDVKMQPARVDTADASRYRLRIDRPARAAGGARATKEGPDPGP